MTFRTVVADPPWRFGDSLPGKGRGASKHYATMRTGDICRLALPPIAPDALLFLWRVAAMQEDALAVAKAWGFTVKSEIVWVKTTGDVSSSTMPTLAVGMGRYTRASHETCLICSRGEGSKLIVDRGVRSVFFAPRGAHSAKPDEFFRLVQRLAAGPYLEIFGRKTRPGWHVVGDEVGTKLEVVA